MRPGLLFETSLVVILVALVGASLLAAEAGFRLGRRHRRLQGDAGRANVSTLQAALLGLLALLLGFSFAMAQSRFDTRKLLVLQEANAIETAILRAQLLPAPEGQRSRISFATTWKSGSYFTMPASTGTSCATRLRRRTGSRLSCGPAP